MILKKLSLVYCPIGITIDTLSMHLIIFGYCTSIWVTIVVINLGLSFEFVEFPLAFDMTLFLMHYPLSFFIALRKFTFKNITIRILYFTSAFHHSFVELPFVFFFIFLQKQLPISFFHIISPMPSILVSILIMINSISLFDPFEHFALIALTILK